MKVKSKLLLLALGAILLIGLALCINITPDNWRYFLSRRIPKIIAIVLTASSIAFSANVFQTITNNRILTPNVLGLDALYLLIQTIIIFVIGRQHAMGLNENLSFIISVTLMVGFSLILFKVLLNEQRSIYFLLLTGLVFGTLFRSVSTFMQVLIDPNEFLKIQSTMFASFNNINTDILTVTGIVTVFVMIYMYRQRKVLDVLSLGRDHAINLGINYDVVLKRLFTLVAVLVSISTALVGPITFLGLLVVNIAREFLGTYKHQYLIVASCLVSIIALVGGQLVVERVLNFNTTLSVIINFIGGIYFIFLLLQKDS